MNKHHFIRNNETAGLPGYVLRDERLQFLLPNKCDRMLKLHPYNTFTAMSGLEVTLYVLGGLAIAAGALAYVKRRGLHAFFMKAKKSKVESDDGRHSV